MIGSRYVVHLQYLTTAAMFENEKAGTFRALPRDFRSRLAG